MPARLLRRLAVASAAALTVGSVATTSAAASTPSDRGGRSAPVQVALIADTPYGDAQRVQFPALVNDINTDREISMVLHAGDVKSGGQTCDDSRFVDLAALYNSFADPFVLTPGDNDWTDCHRTTNGGYLPTERLEAVRELFYPRPGRTLGRNTDRVTTQARTREHRDYVENVRFTRASVVFAAVHVVGSENDLAPWAQLPGGDRPTERLAEFAAREAAALDWLGRAFDQAERTDAPGVLLLMQAEPVATPGFQRIRDLIAERSRDFGRPVLLVHGDEHLYEVEPGYAGVPNLTRLETYGDTATNWLELTVDPGSKDVFSWVSRTVG